MRKLHQPLKPYLDALGPCPAEERVTWRWNDSPLELEQMSYFISALPPAEYVTSVRALLVYDGCVGVLTNLDGTHHVLPGGRVEAGEDWLTALKRELLEEGGWSFSKARLLGVIHYRHLTPRPKAYPYPYPDFLQVVYLAHGSSWEPASNENDYEVDTALVSFAEALLLPLGAGQKLYLRAALASLSNGVVL